MAGSGVDWPARASALPRTSHRRGRPQRPADAVAGPSGERSTGRMRRPSWPLLIAVMLAAALVAASSVRAPAAALDWAPAAPYTSPVAPVRVLELARIPVHDWLPGHRGVDLAAEPGTVVVAPAAGTVTFAGVVVDRAVVAVTHADGARSSLEPVDATVEEGALVVAGQPLGTVSETPGHCAPAACVHWGVRVGERYIDPLDVLDGFGPVRLLPRDRAAFVTRRRRCASGSRAAS